MGSSPMLDEALREKREMLVMQHMAVEEMGDAEAVVATFHRPRYDLVASGIILDGADGVRQRVNDLARAMPGCRIEATAIHHADNAVIVETRTRGLHTGNLLTGNDLSLYC